MKYLGEFVNKYTKRDINLAYARLAAEREYL